MRGESCAVTNLMRLALSNQVGWMSCSFDAIFYGESALRGKQRQWRRRKISPQATYLKKQRVEKQFEDGIGSQKCLEC